MVRRFPFQGSAGRQTLVRSGMNRSNMADVATSYIQGVPEQSRQPPSAARGMSWRDAS